MRMAAGGRLPPKMERRKRQMLTAIATPAGFQPALNPRFDGGFVATTSARHRRYNRTSLDPSRASAARSQADKYTRYVAMPPPPHQHQATDPS